MGNSKSLPPLLPLPPLPPLLPCSPAPPMPLAVKIKGDTFIEFS